MSITATRFATHLRTWLLIAALTGLLIAIGAAIGGGFLYAFVFLAVGMNLVGYWFSDKIALRASRAQPLEEGQAVWLRRIVADLADRASVPIPRLYLIPSDQPNAFATGRNPKNSAVAVTTGLWRRLEPQEVEGVLAHELSHIANRDVLIMTVASFFAMLAALLTRFGMYGGLFGGGRGRDNNGVPVWLIVLLVSIATYFLSQILILAISRYREYAADRGSALITGAPEHLMSALQKIASDMFRIPQQDLREVEGMNAFFIIPTSVKSTTSQLFLTHPPLEKRLEALSRIAREMGRPVA